MQNNNKKIIFVILIVLMSIFIIYPKSMYHYAEFTGKTRKLGNCFGLVQHGVALIEGHKNTVCFGYSSYTY